MFEDKIQNPGEFLFRSKPNKTQLKTNQRTQARCRQCLPTARPLKTQGTLRMSGCKKRTTSDTTASAKPRTWRTAMQTGLFVHVKLPVARRMSVPQGSTVPSLDANNHDLASIPFTQLRILRLLVVAGFSQHWALVGL